MRGDWRVPKREENEHAHCTQNVPWRTHAHGDRACCGHEGNAELGEKQEEEEKKQYEPSDDSEHKRAKRSVREEVSTVHEGKLGMNQQQ